MTVKELIQKLQDLCSKRDQGYEVWLSSDPEGNMFYDIDDATFETEDGQVVVCIWPGEVVGE